MKFNKIIPVIHSENAYQVEENVKICLDCGVKNAFLINHTISYLELISIREFIKNKYPDFWAGVNFLDLSLPMSLKVFENFDGLCHDQFPFIEDKPNFCFFGCISFKYQPDIEENEFDSYCKQIEKVVDVVVTSGDATGSPPTIAKIKKIRSKINKNIPLAVASGININNIKSFSEYVDYFLVASSIIDKDEIFSYQKLNNLLKILE
jgi:hypothetical protein